MYLKKNHDLVDNVFGKLISEKRYTEIGKSAILAPRNVDKINEKMFLDKINKKVTNLLDSNPVWKKTIVGNRKKP